ncbi:MAG TPA: dihydroneopterin aldolase [Rhabdaerophilum sp.]|nr:dihydroneopterin aldolase [Rhabdaerophilum sp.]
MSLPSPGRRDKISIRRIGVFAYHGVYEEEGRLGQRFYISIDAYLDLRAAGRADDLEKSVSYADVAARVQEIAVGQRYKIIEALAEAVAGDLLRAFPLIEDISITVEKPAAAVAAILDSISVTVHRRRDR